VLRLKINAGTRRGAGKRSLVVDRKQRPADNGNAPDTGDLCKEEAGGLRGKRQYRYFVDIRSRTVRLERTSPSTD